MYFLSQHPSKYTDSTLPRDQSLLELGVIDSAGVVELLVFVEAAWGIEISDEDMTRERIRLAQQAGGGGAGIRCTQSLTP